MKKLLVLFSLLLVACQPSQESIATAVAQTVAAAQPSTLPTATLAPIAKELPTIASVPTSTVAPTKPPEPTATPEPTETPAPTNPPQSGTFNNPVPIGQDYRFPGVGIVRVDKSRWKPSQTGYAIIQLTFTCERPADQECSTSDFMLDAIGKSGKGYKHEFDSSIPEPTFGSIFNGTLYGGGSETGFVGFLITDDEQSLIMRIKLFLKQDQIYFKISP